MRWGWLVVFLGLTVAAWLLVMPVWNAAEVVLGRWQVFGLLVGFAVLWRLSGSAWERAVRGWELGEGERLERERREWRDAALEEYRRKRGLS